MAALIFAANGWGDDPGADASILSWLLTILFVTLVTLQACWYICKVRQKTDRWRVGAVAASLAAGFLTTFCCIGSGIGTGPVIPPVCGTAVAGTVILFFGVMAAGEPPDTSANDETVKSPPPDAG